MIAMVFAVPATLCFVVWGSYRGARKRSARGQEFAPAGKRRWEEPPRG